MKILPKLLLNCIKSDTRSVTGSNIRRILLLTNKEMIENVTQYDIEKIQYAEMADGWRVSLIQEITDVKFGQLSIDGFSDEECQEILRFACTS